MSWAALSAPSAAVAALAADLPARAPASSAAALQALANGQEGAAEELAALADAPEVACDAPPPGLTGALAAAPLPYYMLSQDVLTRRHNSMRGTMDICSAAQGQVDAAAAQRERLGAVRPAVAVRAAPPGSPEAQQLAQQLQLWLYGTQRRPVPEALRQQRQQQRHDFQRGMVGAGRGRPAGRVGSGSKLPSPPLPHAPAPDSSQNPAARPARPPAFSQAHPVRRKEAPPPRATPTPRRCCASSPATAPS